MSPGEKRLALIIPVTSSEWPRSQFAMDLEEGMVISFADMKKKTKLRL